MTAPRRRLRAKNVSGAHAKGVDDVSKGMVRLQGTMQSAEVDVLWEERAVRLNGRRVPVSALAVDVPITGTVYGVLLNYKGAWAALEDAMQAPPYKAPPKAPVLYIKPANTLIAHRMPIPCPEDAPELEVGAALGVVIGRTATRVSREQALDYVAGYTVVNDVSIPHDSVYRPALKEKCRDGFCPAGPWVIDSKAVPDPNRVRIRVWVNGELKQENSTAHLIRNVQQLLADVTEFMTLYPGDTLLVGVPEHAPRVKIGDRVRIEMEGVGVLENAVVAEDEWRAGVAS